jgi:hypothetical protein
MKNVIMLLSGVILLAACKKDKFETKPQIKIISVSNEVVPRPNPNPTFTSILLGFTDKEGDVDSSLIFIRQRLNRRNTTPVASEKYTVPEFPNKSEGEIEVILNSSTQLSRLFNPLRIPGSGNVNEPDTMKLSFVLADKKGNRSDTASTIVYVIR